MTHYHFIGIGGTGISPIAQILLEQGHSISGSDLILSPLASELQKMGVQVFIGHDAKNVSGADIVIRSSAIQEDNVEVVAARKANLPVLKRSDFLGELTKGKKVLAVAGTHGKTTTTNMLAWVLTSLGRDPSYIIGGVSKNLKGNAHAGKGSYFVIEADEYDGMFLGLKPSLLIVTNIEHDHPDFYPTPEDYQNAFRKLIQLIQNGGTLLVCHDNPNSLALLNEAPKGIQTLSYGTNEKADFIANNLKQVENYGVQFSAHRSDVFNFENIQLQIPGNHNALNALAVLASASILNLPLDHCKKALESFLGTGRRFDILGEANKIIIINDYAHHPTEIKATLAAARYQYPNRKIWTVWQPHTYSRTLTLLDDFIHAFKESDHVILTEIYRSREKKQDFSSADLVNKIDHPDVKFLGDFPSIADHLFQSMKPGDVLLVLSAGDADQISQQVFERLKRKGVSHG
jgi:UDP-N-acetylmuramate--alanine ligase